MLQTQSKFQYTKMDMKTNRMRCFNPCWLFMFHIHNILNRMLQIYEKRSQQFTLIKAEYVLRGSYYILIFHINYVLIVPLGPTPYTSRMAGFFLYVSFYSVWTIHTRHSTAKEYEFCIHNIYIIYFTQ